MPMPTSPATDERLAPRIPVWAALAAVLALGAVLRFPIAGMPLERDEGGYAYIAQRWLQGETPYRHSFGIAFLIE